MDFARKFFILPARLSIISHLSHLVQSTSTADLEFRLQCSKTSVCVRACLPGQNTEWPSYLRTGRNCTRIHCHMYKVFYRLLRFHLSEYKKAACLILRESFSTWFWTPSIIRLDNTIVRVCNSEKTITMEYFFSPSPASHSTFYVKLLHAPEYGRVKRYKGKKERTSKQKICWLKAMQCATQMQAMWKWQTQRIYSRRRKSKYINGNEMTVVPHAKAATGKHILIVVVRLIFNTALTSIFKHF